MIKGNISTHIKDVITVLRQGNAVMEIDKNLTLLDSKSDIRFQLKKRAFSAEEADKFRNLMEEEITEK